VESFSLDSKPNWNCNPHLRLGIFADWHPCCYYSLTKLSMYPDTDTLYLTAKSRGMRKK